CVPNCCGPIGGDGPLGYEIYVRAGPSFVVSDNRFSKTLETGWDIEGGARALFFDPDRTAAWTIDLGISNTHYQGQRPDLQFGLNSIHEPFAAPFGSGLANVVRLNAIPGLAAPQLVTILPNALLTSSGAVADLAVLNIPGVTIRSFNRTFVNAAFGREWYLTGAPDCESWS